MSALLLAKKTFGPKKWGSMREAQKDPQMERVISSLESMGVRVYGIDGNHGSPSSGGISWDNLAGYEQQKRSCHFHLLNIFKSRPFIHFHIH